VDAVKLVVGLGNPGKEYIDTRHNVGFAVIAALASRYGIKVTQARHSSLLGRGKIAGCDVCLQQPLTYMNLSGQAVKSALQALNLSPADLLVISDDLDLPLGRLRIRGSGGSGGHKGLKSITQSLDTDAFPRLRFGIGRPREQMAVEDYVLSRWDGEEKSLLRLYLERAVLAIETVVLYGVDEAANLHNGEPE